jgi:hypothetical protein
MLQVSIESARLKFGMNGTRMKSLTWPRSARSHVFPSVPARIAAPHAVSSRVDCFCLRKAHAMAGTAASETASHAREGKSPHAMPRFTASWIQSRPGMSVVVVPDGKREKARDFVATSRQAPARAIPRKAAHRRFTSLQRPDRAPRRVVLTSVCQLSPQRRRFHQEKAHHSSEH